MKFYTKDKLTRDGWTIQDGEIPECPEHGKMPRDQSSTQMIGGYICNHCGCLGIVVADLNSETPIVAIY